MKAIYNVNVKATRLKIVDVSSFYATVPEDEDDLLFIVRGLIERPPQDGSGLEIWRYQEAVLLGFIDEGNDLAGQMMNAQNVRCFQCETPWVGS